MSLKENQVGSRALLGLSKGVKCLKAWYSRVFALASTPNST